MVGRRSPTHHFTERSRNHVVQGPLDRDIALHGIIRRKENGG